MSSRKLKISLLQMNVEAGNPEGNFSRLERMLDDAVQKGEKPDLVLLPEMWNTGYALDRIGELADSGGRRTRELISGFCKKYGIMAVAGSIAEGTEQGVRNTTLVFDREGRNVGEYSKIHLFRLMDEEKALIPGTKPGRLTLEGIEAGTMICYDIRFPELTRTLALSGAEILFVPAEWPNPRLHHWRTLLMARAIENQMFVVACNRVGTSDGTTFFGHSMVIDPWGEVLAEGEETEEIIQVEIDLSLTEKVRSRIPVFEDRRPQHYKL